MSEFTYEYLRTLLTFVKDNYEVRPLDEARYVLREAEEKYVKRALFLRHDIDVCPERALRVAELEHELGLKASYMFMVSSPLYDFAATQEVVFALAALGHEIGLHLGSWEDVYEAIGRWLRITALPLRSVSIHRPRHEQLRGPLELAGLVNAYAADLMRCYISDSGGAWRCGDPMEALTNPQGNPVQMLIHPIWWGEKEAQPVNRIAEFYLEQAQEHMKVLNDGLHKAVGSVWREEEGGTIRHECSCLGNQDRCP